MASKGDSASGGVGFGGLLALVFVAAKLWGQIDWSWWWVFAPLWIPFGIVLFVILACVVVGLIMYAAESIYDSMNERARKKVRQALQDETIRKNGWTAHSRVHTERHKDDFEQS